MPNKFSVFQPKSATVTKVSLVTSQNFNNRGGEFGVANKWSSYPKPKLQEIYIMMRDGESKIT